MTRPGAAIREAVASLRVAGDGTCTVFGERFALPGRDRRGLATLAPATLANALYWTLHCRVSRGSHHQHHASNAGGERERFVERLARANAGIGPWQAGWTVRDSLDRGRLLVHAFGIDFVASARDVRTGGRRRAAGAAASVRVPNEYRNFAPGYYTALGDLDHDASLAPTARVYWNVAAEGAARLVAEITRRLNAARIPFRYKTPDDPARFARVDTGVLYLPADSFRAVRRHLQRTHESMRPWLRDALSPFVKPLARGVGAADDPGDGSSFGSHRCAVVAEALLAAVRDGDVSAAAVARRLRARGFNPARLYLAPGARDRFAPLGARER